MQFQYSDKFYIVVQVELPPGKPGNAYVVTAPLTQGQDIKISSNTDDAFAFTVTYESGAGTSTIQLNDFVIIGDPTVNLFMFGDSGRVAFNPPIQDPDVNSILLCPQASQGNCPVEPYRMNTDLYFATWDHSLSID